MDRHSIMVAFLTPLNSNEDHWMVCLVDISDRAFTIIDPYDPANTGLHKVSDESKIGLSFIGKDYDDNMKETGYGKGIASNKI